MTLPALCSQEAFTTSPTATVPTWENHGRVRSFIAKAGKTADLDRDAAGTCVTVVDSRDRELDPANEDSPHWPYVIPNRQVRLGFGYVAEVMRDNPAHYWRLNDVLSNQIYRNEQRTTTVLGVNSPTQNVAGILTGNTAVTFAGGSSQYIDTGDLSVFETGECTYEAWINTSTAGTVKAIFGEGRSAGANGYSWLRTTALNKVSAEAENTSGTTFACTSTTTITDGQWHHVVLTRSTADNKLRLYVDGVPEGTPPTVTGSFSDQNRSAIGALYRSALSNYFTGTIDEVAVYTTALSAARVAAHYAAGVKAIGGFVFRGYADAHNVSYEIPDDAITTIPATDRFKLLARVKVSAFDRPEERTSQRAINTLSNVGLLFNSSVIVGNSIMMAEDLTDEKALDVIQAACETEQGRVFVERDGLFRFIGRLGFNTHPYYTTSQATFSDSGAAGTVPYSDIVFENSDTMLRNYVEITHPTHDPVVESDATSITNHFTVDYSRPVRDATRAAMTATAENILDRYKDPRTRVLSVTVNCNRTTATYPHGLYGKVMNLALGMRVTVEMTSPPGGGDTISQECFILSHSTRCDAQKQIWQVTFGLALAFDVESYGEWDTGLWNTATWGY